MELNIEQFGKGNELQYLKAESEHIMAQTETSKHYKLCFSDFKRYNARVNKIGEQKQVEIDIGVVLEIFHMSYIVLMNEHFFTELGSGHNMEQYKFWDMEMPSIDSYDNNLKAINFYTAPDNPKRIAAAQAVARLGIEFIIFHELGHVLGGHFDYINDTLGISELQAYGTEQEVKQKTKNNVTYQAIEMDADIIAIHLLIENLLCNKEKLTTFYFKDFKMDWSKIIMVAITIAFFLMDPDTKIHQSSLRYLPRDYRYHLVISKLFSKLKKEYIEIRTPFENEELSIAPCLLCNDFLSKFCNKEKICEIPLSETDKYYEDVILNQWKNIREDIQKYAGICLPE